MNHFLRSTTRDIADHITNHIDITTIDDFLVIQPGKPDIRYPDTQDLSPH